MFWLDRDNSEIFPGVGSMMFAYLPEYAGVGLAPK
jgi:hypothetical protein